jgi:hypothetical protein
MTYTTIESEYFEAKNKYHRARQLISRDRSQAIDLLREASDLLSNCNSPQAENLANEVQNLLDQYGG